MAKVAQKKEEHKGATVLQNKQRQRKAKRRVQERREQSGAALKIQKKARQRKVLWLGSLNRKRLFVIL